MKLRNNKTLLGFLIISQLIVFVGFISLYLTKNYTQVIIYIRSNVLLQWNDLSKDGSHIVESMSYKPANATYKDEKGKIVTYNESYRPQYHYSPPHHWMNDPCGLVYHEGEYHLFYQYNPVGMNQHHLCWGHAVSPDMFHWETLDIAIMHGWPDQQRFSGSGAVDHYNTTGLGKDALVLIYTNHYRSNDIQHQHLAYSLNNGRTIENYINNPVLGTNVKHVRDPKIFWYAPLNEWRMVTVYAFSFKMLVFGSKNLIDWDYYSMFEGKGTNLWVWETPDLFELPIEGEGGATKWMLVMAIKNHEKNHADWATSYSRHGYYIGNFDGYNFIPDYPDAEVQFMDYGHDFFAGQTFENEKYGRRIMIGWLNSWLIADKAPTLPWRGEQTLPRMLSLVRNHCNNGRLELWQNPVPEVRSLRTKSWKYENMPLPRLAQQILEIRGKTLEVHISVVIRQTNDWFKLLLHANQAFSRYTLLGYNHAESLLYNDVNKSGILPHPQFHKLQRHAYIKPCDGRIEMKIFLDWNSIEVFVNHGAFTITTKVFPEPEYDSIGIQGTDNLLIEHFRVYALKSVWH